MRLPLDGPNFNRYRETTVPSPGDSVPSPGNVENDEYDPDDFNEAQYYRTHVYKGDSIDEDEEEEEEEDESKKETDSSDVVSNDDRRHRRKCLKAIHKKPTQTSFNRVPMSEYVSKSTIIRADQRV